MRPKPRLWLRLPVSVTDAPSLAAHLREWVNDPTHPAFRLVHDTADQVAQCQPVDADCLRQVVQRLDTDFAATPMDDRQRFLESLAHAVDRVADSLDADPADVPVLDHEADAPPTSETVPERPRASDPDHSTRDDDHG